MDFIVLFFKEDILLEGKSEVDKMRRKAPRFWAIFAIHTP